MRRRKKRWLLRSHHQVTTTAVQQICTAVGGGNSYVLVLLGCNKWHCCGECGVMHVKGSCLCFSLFGKQKFHFPIKRNDKLRHISLWRTHNGHLGITFVSCVWGETEQNVFWPSSGCEWVCSTCLSSSARLFCAAWLSSSVTDETLVRTSTRVWRSPATPLSPPSDTLTLNVLLPSVTLSEEVPPPASGR